MSNLDGGWRSARVDGCDNLPSGRPTAFVLLHSQPRCVFCGRFVRVERDNVATVVTPDTHFTSELIEWYHRACEQAEDA